LRSTRRSDHPRHFCHAGTPLNEPGMRSTMFGYGQFHWFE
jgi:hypothetical protein